jgi:hypothetical protein
MAGLRNPGVDTSQFEVAADFGVDEAQGVEAVPGGELGTAGVGLVGDLDDGPAYRQAGPGRQVPAAQVQVANQLVRWQPT